MALQGTTEGGTVTVDDFAAFMMACYDAAEALAKAAAADGTPEWSLRDDPDPVIGESRIYDANGAVVVYDEGAPSPNEAAFIAAVDPAHRLADVKLKRAILAEHKHYPAFTPDEFDFGCGVCHDNGDYGVCGYGWCATVRQLGTEFTEHAGYKQEWAPE